MAFSDPSRVVRSAPLRGGFAIYEGEGPLVATAIHDGHHMRAEMLRLSALSDDERLREEDPGTGRWTRVAPTRVVVATSRFEVDLNRPVDEAVYEEPGDAWGLDLWKDALPAGAVERSRVTYRAFYDALEALLRGIVARHGRAVVYDLHSYNHRRAGPEAPPADPGLNPDVNVGTGSMDRVRWGPVVDAFSEAMAHGDYLGGRLDVRENVRFRGGHLSRWIHETFPERVCCLAIEMKKFFMDEWSGVVDPERHAAVGRCLASTTGPVLGALASS